MTKNVYDSDVVEIAERLDVDPAAVTAFKTLMFSHYPDAQLPESVGTYKDRAGEEWIVYPNGTLADRTGDARPLSWAWMLAPYGPFIQVEG